MENFANFFSRTLEWYDIKIFYKLVTDSMFCTCGKFYLIIYRIDKIYAAFSRGNLAVFLRRYHMLHVSTIQDSANTVSVNTVWVDKTVQNVFHHPIHTDSCQTKLGTALLIGHAENYCPISYPVRLFIQKLFWASDEGFKIASRVAPRHDISMAFKFEQLLSVHRSFTVICGQFS